ncbi:ATP-binding protein [Streptomyces sp. NPDC059371]|uniref:ATP-binding protein n=1 Tax=Streptomyces sp. NPDC059371 TaxID=3346812 RepID=UPI003680C8A7
MSFTWRYVVRSVGGFCRVATLPADAGSSGSGGEIKALKAPAPRDAAARLAERARDEGWSHEEYLAACLQREVAARDSLGAEGRIRAARFPSRKSLETSTSTTSGR